MTGEVGGGSVPHLRGFGLSPGGCGGVLKLFRQVSALETDFRLDGWLVGWLISEG